MSFQPARVPARLYRLSRNSDPTKRTEWRYLANAALGRWDDPNREYRVLYTSDTEVGAYVEVLQDLRPSASAELLVSSIVDDGGLESALPTVEAAARERLRQYYFGALIATHAEDDVIVDVASAASRSELEARLRDDLGEARLKRGDFSGHDQHLTQRVSRCIYTAARGDDQRFAGIMAQSAEHEGTSCYSYFETARETNELRGRLMVHFSRQALDEEEHVKRAVEYLVASTATSVDAPRR
jgi:hypothetical protein